MAAPLGLIILRVLNSEGQPVQGASVYVRKEGAVVQSLIDATHVAVDAPGAILAGDTVQVYPNATTAVVAAVSATQITVSAPGFSLATNNNRLTITNPLPTLYADPMGNETKANPLASDVNGLVFAWAPITQYDYLATGGNTPNGPIIDQLVQDYPALGVGQRKSNAFPNLNVGLADSLDTIRLYGDTEGVFALLNLGTIKLVIYGNGKIETLGGVRITGGDGLYVADGLTVRLPVASLNPNVINGGVSVNMNGDDDTVDFAVPATPTAIPNVSVNYTPASATSKLQITAVVPFEALTGVAPRTITATLFEDATPIAEGKMGAFEDPTNPGLFGVIPLLAFRTGSAAARTYTIKVSKTGLIGATVYTIKNSSDRKARIVVVEAGV